MGDKTEEARHFCREYLEQADVEKLTERGLREAVAAALGGDPSSYRSVVQECVEIWLNANSQPEEEGDDAPTASAGKRSAAADEAEPDAKRPRIVSSGGEFAVLLDDEGAMRATVSTFRGNVTLGIRKFWQDKDETWKPTQKGLNLPPPQWEILKANLGAIQTAQDNEDTDYSLHLAPMRKVTVSKLSRRCNVDLREYYTNADGELAPTKKGVSLSPDLFAALVAAGPDLEKALAARAVPGSPKAEPNPAGPAAKSPAAPGPAQMGTSGSAAATAKGQGSTEAAGTLERDDEGQYADLGGKKRAAVSVFRGMAMVSLREYYEKDGIMRPGSKGISLSAAQFQALVDGAEGLTQALAAKEPGVARVTLSAKRFADITEFKGKAYVGVREYYEKDGEMLPGKKGLNLNEEQWGKLSQALPALVDAVQKVAQG